MKYLTVLLFAAGCGDTLGWSDFAQQELRARQESQTIEEARRKTMPPPPPRREKPPPRDDPGKGPLIPWAERTEQRLQKLEARIEALENHTVQRPE